MAQRLTYSTDLEEMAYSKDPKALLQAADFIIYPEGLKEDHRDASFFEAGEELGDGTPVHWFTFWEDEKTALFFRGDLKAIRRRIRKMKDRPQ